MLRIVLIASVLLAIAATTVSGFAYTASSSPGQNCDSPCGPWHEYGWPLAWRSDWPAWLLDNFHDNSSFWGMHGDGVDRGAFIFDVAAWFAMIAPPLLAIAWLWRYARPRPSAPTGT